MGYKAGSTQVLWLGGSAGARQTALAGRAVAPAPLRAVVRAKPAPVGAEALGRLQQLWCEYAAELLGARPRAAELAFARCELVGALCRVVQSSNPSQLGLEGTVLNEGAHVFYIQTSPTKVVTIVKKTCVFDVVVDAERVFRLFGATLDRHPALRSKAKPKRLLSVGPL